MSSHDEFWEIQTEFWKLHGSFWVLRFEDSWWYLCKRQVYHGNVFVGNHFKEILAKDGNDVFNFSKLYSILPDESSKKTLFDLFELHRVAQNLMAHKGFLNSDRSNN